MNIYLDCDEVLLETAISHASFLKENYNLIVDTGKYPSQWLFTNSDISSYEISTQKYIQSLHFTKIKPTPYAIEGVKALKKLGHKLFVVTSISDNPLARHARIKNLHDVFGDVFEDITCLPLGHANKGIYYQQMPKGIVVDDSFHNILLARKSGHDVAFIGIKQNTEWHVPAQKQGIKIFPNLYSLSVAPPCFICRYVLSPYTKIYQKMTRKEYGNEY